MKELWKTITYAPNYEISNLSNIKNKKTSKLITINYERLKKDNKRARPGLLNNGNIKNYYLHRIVAEHFIENPDNLPEVNHIDGDFYNNRVGRKFSATKADALKELNKVFINQLNRMREEGPNYKFKENIDFKFADQSY